MRVRTLPVVAAALIVLATVVTLVAATVLYGFDLVPTVFGMWAIVGALIVALQPRNAVGWLFSAVGLLWVTGFFAADAAVSADPGGWHSFASWWSEWTWIAAFVCIASSLVLIPTGRTTSRRWAWALGTYAGAGLLVVVLTWFQETLQGPDDALVVDNPIGVPGLGDVGDAGAGPLLYFAGLGIGLASLVVRFRHGDTDERRRLKLIALAAAAMVACGSVGGYAESGLLADLAWAVAAGIVPVACGIAILRHQLFDVDRVISRTLVYGSLTVILGAAYVGLVLVGQALFSSVAGGGDLAIAVSTLVVAALFLPVRSRVQRLVDRRFYRRRYDAQRTLEAFGARLREEVDLDALTGDLRGVVTETMQPAHMSLWLRQEAPR